MTRLSPEREAEIRALADAATPGPWKAGNVWVAGCMERFGAATCTFCARGGEPLWEGPRDINGTTMLAHAHYFDDEDGHSLSSVAPVAIASDKQEIAGNYDYEEGGILRGDDAAFIAAARMAVPALLAEVEALRGERDAATKVAEAAEDGREAVRLRLIEAARDTTYERDTFADGFCAGLLVAMQTLDAAARSVPVSTNEGATT